MAEDRRSGSDRRTTHYGAADDPYEVIKVLKAKLTPQEYAGFLKGNTIKYMMRHSQKDGLRDVEKGSWYGKEFATFIAEVGHDNVYSKPKYWGEEYSDPVLSVADVMNLHSALVCVTVFSTAEPHFQIGVNFPIGEDGDTDFQLFDGTLEANRFIRDFQSKDKGKT